MEVDLELSAATDLGRAQSYHHIGRIFLIKGKYDEAFEYYNKALSIRLNKLSKTHPEVASSYTELGDFFYYKYDYQKALEYYDKALGIRLKTLGEKNPNIAEN